MNDKGSCLGQRDHAAVLASITEVKGVVAGLLPVVSGVGRRALVPERSNRVQRSDSLRSRTVERAVVQVVGSTSGDFFS